VTPTSFDRLNGRKDPYGNPLSAARMFLEEQSGDAGTLVGVVDPTGIVDRCNTASLIEPGGTPVFPGCTDDDDPEIPTGGLDVANELELVDGDCKTPHLRNVALTPPYFHSGNYSDLRSVIEFYCRGGSRRDKSLIKGSNTGDTSGSGLLGKGLQIPPVGPDFGRNVDFFVRDLKCTDGTRDYTGDGNVDFQDDQIGAMVAFMKTLTDYRVQCDKAPFDHPELPVSIGHTAEDKDGDGRADDIMAVIPETGAGGYDADENQQYCLPNSGDLFDANLRNRLVVTEASPGNSGNNGNGKAKGNGKANGKKK
jgi:hypothetical protein